MSRSRVFASHSQYWLVGGADPDVSSGQPELPSLVSALGSEALRVTTGVGTGYLTVETDALHEPPEGAAEGWDVIGEIDISSTDGSIRVCDMFGGPSDGLSDLAAAGPGLYRVRVHVKDRRNVDGDSSEMHSLIAWPARSASTPRLLTALDTYGRYWTGELTPPEPEADETNLAVASAVDRLLRMVDSGVRPTTSGQVVTLRHHGVIEAPLDDVYEIVSSPIGWVGSGGGQESSGFTVLFSRDPADMARLVMAEGKTLVDDVYDGEHVSFTWAWRIPILPPDGELNLKERLGAVLNGAPFPDPPEVIDVRLHGGRSTTEVELTISGVPAEFADVTDAVWAWGMKRLARRATKQPAEMFPWGNYY